MKKRNWIRILVAALCIMVLAGGASAATMQWTLATGGTSGTYYPLGGAIAQIISNKVSELNITAQSTGASVENINLIAAGDVDLALVQNDIADYAYKGTEFFNREVKNIRAIARLYPETIHVVVPAGSDIESIADFKGKKISVGAPGSGNEANARQILGVYGLTYKDFEPLFLSYAETADHYKDRLLDGFIYTTGAPNSSIQDISTLQKIKFLPIEGEMREKLMSEYPFFAVEVMPANTYNGQTDPYQTVAVQAILIANEELSEEAVYNMTKAFFENLDEVGESHHKGKSITLEKALDGITIPFHPGAEKYYKEKGIM
jgi:TRAP transporter TAXI family solute receptor